MSVVMLIISNTQYCYSTKKKKRPFLLKCHLQMSSNMESLTMVHLTKLLMLEGSQILS